MMTKLENYMNLRGMGVVKAIVIEFLELYS